MFEIPGTPWVVRLDYVIALHETEENEDGPVELIVYLADGTKIVLSEWSRERWAKWMDTLQARLNLTAPLK